MTYTVYFRDSEECFHCLSHGAASESEARDWFTRLGMARGGDGRGRRLSRPSERSSGRVLRMSRREAGAPGRDRLGVSVDRRRVHIHCRFQNPGDSQVA